MKIQIFKKNGDESIYYTLNSEEEKTLNFDSIKDLSKMVLETQSKTDKDKVEITVSDSSLELYKTTVENVLKSVEEDTELIELFQNQNQSTNEETKDIELQVEETEKND